MNLDKAKEALVSFIHKSGELSLVKTSKRDVTVPGGSAVTVKCRVNTGPIPQRGIPS